MSEMQNMPTNASESPSQPLQVDVKIGSIRPEGNVKAYASVNLNGCFAVRNVKVLESSKGLFVSMPSYRAGNGEYRDICFPVTKEFREQLNSAVLDAYHQALIQGQKEALTQQPPEVPKQEARMQMAGV